MKILLTADTHGGVWTYATELAEALAARGNDVTIAALGHLPSDEQLARAPHTHVVARECALEWMPDRWEDIAASGDWLLDVAAELRPDVVHLNAFAFASLRWDVPVVVVAHSDVASWFEAVRGTAPPPEWDRYRTAVQEGLDRADVVVAPTRAMLDALKRHYVLGAVTRVIPNGVDTAPGPSAKRAVVLAAGRAWDEAKNVAALERIASRLPWPVLICGEGSRNGYVAEQRLAAAMSRAEVFAAPARYEPFGLAILEAARAGCALVLGDIDSLRETWRDAAMYAPASDDGAIAHALTTVIEDEPLRRSLAARSRRRAAQLSARRMADAYASLYSKLTSLEHV